MKYKLVDLNWDKYHKFFCIHNMKEVWKASGIKRQWGIRTNGAKKKNIKDTCLDVNITLGYLAISYTNYRY
jgi:hypothetical protein